ncbi:ferredoxin [Thermocatellispora tengchongensis]|uniref:ferredoxin n=1 Tax=Thermocatellispora tengchongensis TaxID=1073253 RepID=UPI00160D89B9|nr:ferredoxin [Thermocatellispora tengchongensis]
MYIAIDAGRCMGHGRCYAVAEDLLSDDEQGYVAQCGQTLQIPEGLLGQARDAADACPEGAISILEHARADA